ncbi:MAG: winged helix-turn-helix domain-containing protein [Thermoanaerobaculales bacterium]|nr:winged helix-turn-helix domain-containing protein [Thermoanaerobaculales bacterium]
MRYEFEDFVLDPSRRTLECKGAEIAIGDRAIGVLIELVSSAGRMVGKRDLLDTVWDDVVVGEDNLTKAVGEIRSVLGDSPAEARFVRTVHRRGYVFVAPVSSPSDDMAAPLRPPVDEAPALEKVDSSRKRWLMPAVVAVCGVLFLAAVVIRMELGPATRPATPQSPFIDWPMRPLAGVPLGFFKPAFSPDADAMVAVTSNHTSGLHSLFLIAPNLEQPLQLTDDLEVRGPSPVFSADGQSIWFTTFRHHPERGLVPEVMEIPAVGGTPQSLIEDASAASPSPDGRSIAIARVSQEGTSINVRDETGREHTVADVGFWPRFSPDGSWIAYTTSDPEGGNGRVWVVRPDGSGRRRLNDVSSQVYGLCWTADSRFVVFASDADGTMDLWVSGVDDPKPVAVTRSPGSCTAPAVSRDGARLVFAFAVIDVELHIASSLTETPRTLLDVRGIAGAAISPDGKRVALAAKPDSAAPPVSVLNIASGRRHAVSGLRCEQIRWAPDGDSLVATAPSPDGSAMWIWRIPVDGRAAEPLTTGPGHWTWPDLDPGGERLAAVRRCDNGWQITIIDLGTGQTEAVARSRDAHGLRWSPDGSALAWSGGCRPADAQSSGVWVASLDDGSVRRIAADGAWPAWEPSGRSLVYLRFLDRAGLWRMQIVDGASEPVQAFAGKLASYQFEGIDLGRDGHPLLVLTAASKPVLYSLQPQAPRFSE